jgi:hypothetical protein
MIVALDGSSAIHPSAVISEVGARSRKPLGGFRRKQTFFALIGNDRLWVEICRFRLADRAAVFGTAQAIHSANGQWLTCCVPLNCQNPIQALQPSLPEAPFWANVQRRQAESVRGIETEPAGGEQ